ncbi:ribosome biogenesis GTP-binding protein YihA/YsxC [Alicyclobacillus acidocaldarius]|uniref:Probable GTP-binding protein EngB n=1 Tax=Alicyclobacillus acidocaldarius subsp. acidocaldarius (strain ATCC 27009 / DSM 446 / BCRC 14685 / JCM 5260 / KCTC 1825 / NBRC 15652 / NCIMB 11725 / NRRL B-14509 / 104-IA) TaxID=521098 RepID=C8WXN2_ALIAD|nr:ribosome biogenesis GTP-binding protein YihA/YsxC [Alicyclobacillus acidocaldarius]ACV58853.1 ribosome biogenesis GTP-binding protein YsxC [Alicyclobacillus acidocaldarius subsp. acidocaldarius DSM 446]
MIIRSTELEATTVRPDQWPKTMLPEFAFLGRSNVGKSTLLNRLLNRKQLARVSSQPGKTRQINFYLINQSFRFVDLPGYGYAAVSKQERQRFAAMIDRYLNDRECLRRIFHLIDIRHEPTKDDVAVHAALLELGVPVSVVATKADKIGRSHVPKHVKVIRDTLRTPVDIWPVSAEKRTGLEALWAVMEGDLAEPGTSDAPGESPDPAIPFTAADQEERQT